MPARSRSVVVAGGGIVGLAAAAVIRRSAPRVHVVVVDPKIDGIEIPEAIGQRVIALTPASINVFEQLAVLPTMPDFALTPYHRMRVWDAGVSAGEGIEFASHLQGMDNLGAIADVASLQAALYQALLLDDAVTFRQAEIVGLESRSGSVVTALSDNERIESSLVVGADGRNSKVRDCLGSDLRRWSHHQCAVVATLEAELDHQSTALQRFLPTGPLALLPLQASQVSLVWSTTTEHARELVSMPPDRFSDAVSEASDRVLGRLQATSRVVSFKLESAYVTNPIGPRAVLIGDAAHAIHPLAGQGANLGFSDAVALAGVIADAVDEQADFGDPPWLRRYRRMRRSDNLTTLFGLDFVNRLFARETGVLADLRRRGMRWFGQSQIARQLAISHASAMRGADPLRQP
ncbi:MAG: FAD-dependent monooxygenase [Pseudomonadota bacterium]